MPIFDQGYQHWQGHLAGHGWRWAAVARHGIRIGMKNMFVRIIVLLAWLPALALGGAVCLWGMFEQKVPWAMSLLTTFGVSQDVLASPPVYRSMVWTLCFHVFIVTEMYYIMVLILVIGPSLISLDLRFNALPLYFSRPLKRSDYFLGKLGVIGFFLALVTIVPAIVAWVLGVLFSLNFGVAIDTLRILGAVVLYGLIVVTSAGLLMLAFSSLSRNSRYVALLWAGFWLLGSIVSSALEGIHVHNHFNKYWRVASSMNYQREAEFQRDNQEERLDAAKPRDLPAAELVRRAQKRKERAEARSKAEGEEQEKINRLNAAFSEERQHDWRQVISYVQNCIRIGDGLLGYYEALDQFESLLGSSRPSPKFSGRRSHQPPPDTQRMDSRWPWYWSGSVLLVLGGLSIWILNTRVKSLDRLR